MLLFDPVVFENLKVALENQLYDLDNLDNRILITDRKDIVDMAVMSRKWSLGFTLPHRKQACPLTAEMILSSSIRDLSDEILERQGASPACSLLLRFTCFVEQPLTECPTIERIIDETWDRGLVPEQRLTATFGDRTHTVDQWVPLYYENTIDLPLNRRINEEQMEDLEALIEHTIRTLGALDKVVL